MNRNTGEIQLLSDFTQFLCQEQFQYMQLYVDDIEYFISSKEDV